MIDWLKHEWYNLASKYSLDKDLVDEFWNELYRSYTSKSRFYHNFSHIYNMLRQVDAFESELNNLDAFKFSIWYHDIIYKSSKKDNEEKSALVSGERLLKLGVDKATIFLVNKMIISTKKHQLVLTDNIDNAYLLDIDLSILGSNWETYQIYLKNIRKEYKIYPDFLYNPGRKKVLKHFLEREILYFTDSYKLKYEKQARQNLEGEIKLL